MAQALTLWFRGRDPSELAFLAVMLSFTLLLLPGTVFVYLDQVQAAGPIFKGGVETLQFLAVASMYYTLPHFTHSFCPPSWIRKADRWAAGLCVFFAAVILAGRIGPAAPVFNAASFVLLTLSIGYTIALGAFAHRLGTRSGKPYISAKWKRVRSSLIILTLVFIPFFIVIDFFSWKPLVERLPRHFAVFPGFYAAWNLLYLISSAWEAARHGEGLAQAKDSIILPDSICAAQLRTERFGISGREAEVAALLLSGLSYREIAERLHISLATVKTHVNRLYQKSGASNKLELLRNLAENEPKTANREKG